MSTVPFTNIQYICKARVKDASQLKNIIFLVGRGEDCTPPPPLQNSVRPNRANLIEINLPAGH